MALEWGYGIRSLRKNALNFLQAHDRQYLIGFFLITSISCLSTSNKAERQEGTNSQNSSEALDNFFLEEQNERAQETEISKFPETANARDTRLLLVTSTLPAQDRLQSCQNEMKALAQNIRNLEDLILQKKRILYEIGQNSNLYHWCFFKLVTVLDNKLQNDDLGIRLEVRYQNFNLYMKALWILAAALNDTLSTRRYLVYLRTRYIQISRDFFGRQIDVIRAPLGDRGQNQGIPKKPQGEVSDSLFD